MKKFNLIELIIQAIILILFVICFLLIPIDKTANFWVSFTFTLVSLIIYIVMYWQQKSKNIDSFISLIYPIGCFAVVILQIIWNLFVLLSEFINFGKLVKLTQNSALFRDTPVYSVIDTIANISTINIFELKVVTIATPINIILNLLSIIVYIALSFYMHKGTSHIVNVEKNISNNTRFIKILEIDLKNILNNVKEPSMRNMLEKLIDKVKYSDPVSNESLMNIENQIHENMYQLVECAKSNDDECMKQIILNISNLLDQRNEYCKATK